MNSHSQPEIPELPVSSGRAMTPAAAKDPLPSGVWVLICAAFLIALGFGLVAPILPRFAASFDVSITAAAVIVSVFSFGRLLFAPVSGKLINTFGERRIYMLGLAIVTLSTFACAFAYSYRELLIYRGLGGIGSVMFTVSAIGLLVRMSPPLQRGRISAVYAGAFLSGSICGPILGGLLGNFGMRVPFFIYSAMTFIALIVVAILLRGRGVASSGTVSSESRESGETTPAVLPPMSLKEALGSSTYRAALGSSFANGFANFGVRVAIIPLFIATLSHGGPAYAGYALAAFAIGNGMTLLITNSWSDKWGRRPLVMAGFAFSGFTTVILGQNTVIILVLLLCVLAGIGGGISNPPLQASVGDVIGNNRSGGTVLSTYQMAGDFGTILGPLVAGLIADHYGYSWVFVVTGSILLCGAFCWIFAKESAPNVLMRRGRTVAKGRAGGKSGPGGDNGRGT